MRLTKTRVKLISFFIIAILIYLLLSLSSKNFSYQISQDETDINIKINFMIPMKHIDLKPKVELSPEILTPSFHYDVKWVSSSTAFLKIRQFGFPQGQEIKYKITDVPTIIPFLHKNINGKIRPSVSLKLISNTKFDNIPSKGPVPIYFNSPIDTKELVKLVTLPEPGKLIPITLEKGGKKYTDDSKWLYYPQRPLLNNRSYKIILNSSISNLSGKYLGKPYNIIFTTTVPPKVVTTSPVENTKITNLFQPIKVSLDQEILTAQITVTDNKNGQKLPGKLAIERNEVIFTPAYAFLPSHSYVVSFVGTSKQQGSIDKFQFSFSTLDMGENYWVDVSLLEKHTMRVYKGDKLIREMLVSGGKDETPSPLGNFYTQDRGHSFWSHRFGEGATYWVRLINQVLIHSIPRDSQWKIKKDEHKKLGLPASHGCIRLADEDAEWFYVNIPRGTLVIIHK